MPTSQAVLLPEVLAVTAQRPESIDLGLRIPRELAYLPGHFPQVAVVPGVVQIQWAVHYARQHLHISDSFDHMEVIKFKELLLPDQHATLTLDYAPHNGRLQFRVHAGAVEFSSGRIYFKTGHV